MKTVTTSTGRVSIHSAGASPGPRPQISQSNFRTVTPRAPKRSSRIRNGIAQLRRSFTTGHSAKKATGRTVLFGAKITTPARGKRSRSCSNQIISTVATRFMHAGSAWRKSGHELVLAKADEGKIFPVSAYTIGYIRDLSHGKGIDIGLG